MDRNFIYSCNDKNLILSQKVKLSLFHLNLLRKYSSPTAHFARLKRRKRGCRGGSKKVKLLFWNIHGRNNFCTKYCDNFLDEFSVNFLCETWQCNPSSLLRSKDCFFSEAKKPPLGRPSCGLEFYANTTLNLKLASKSLCHLLLSSSLFNVIGVYYPPKTDLDDIIEDLLTALDSCNHATPTFLGGDFNLHYEDAAFKSVSDMLLNFNLTLQSNPDIPSFIGFNGESCVDHIFASHPISVSTANRIESDHLPLVTSFKIPKPNLSDTSATTATFSTKKFQQELINFDYDMLPFLSDSSIRHKFNDLLLKCKSDRPPTRSTSVKTWFTPFLYELRHSTLKFLKLYRKFSRTDFRQLYLMYRSAYSKNMKLAKKQFFINESLKLLSDAKNNGISSLYKACKKYSPPTSSLISLTAWVRHCATIFQTLPSPSFHPIPNVLSCNALDLIKTFSRDEVLLALNQQKSNAKSLLGISPNDLKHTSEKLSYILMPILNSCLSNSSFPDEWSDLCFFFLHKKGSYTDPSNYRSIAIVNPFLKLFNHLLNFRLSQFTFLQNLLPEFQFGFRNGRSAISAVSIFQQCILKQFSFQRGRVFACFIDFAKAFDSVDRYLLLCKLQLLGVPHTFCLLLHNIWKQLRLHVNSNNSISPSFPSFNGCPQGDPMSPLLFNIFISDLPDCLLHKGIQLNGIDLKYIQYADDLILLAPSPVDLQEGIDSIANYCTKNNLQINTSKSKCLTFYKGRCSIPPFTLNQTPLENVNNFCYLGITVTTRLSSTKHVEKILARVSSRIGLLYAKLPIKKFPLDLVKEIFRTYILPVLCYGCHLWLPYLCVSSSNKINALWLKYLKRYLGVPYCTTSSLIYFFTQSSPLLHFLQHFAANSFLSTSFPSCLDGLKLQPPSFSFSSEQSLLASVPSYFWHSQVVHSIPLNPHSRRALCYSIFDLYHPHICKTKKFHTLNYKSCFCKYCNVILTHYHHLSCPKLINLSLSDFLCTLLSS